MKASADIQNQRHLGNDFFLLAQVGDADGRQVTGSSQWHRHYQYEPREDVKNLAIATPIRAGGDARD